jgi:hypothetical protein
MVRCVSCFGRIARAHIGSRSQAVLLAPVSHALDDLVPKNRLLNNSIEYLPSQTRSLCVRRSAFWRRGVSMGHDPNGRAVPPRCEECDAPLTSDERRLGSTSTRFFCLECQLALNPLPRKSRQRGRPRAELHATSAEHFVPRIAV